MFDSAPLARLVVAVRRYAEGFEPELLPGSDAAVVARQATQIANIASTLAAAAAKRAADCSTWRRRGERSAAHDLAHQAGIGVRQAQDMLDLAGRLESQPDVKKAACAGELSPAQAAAVSDAAAADPAAETRLVNKAKRSSLGELKDECARTKAAAQPDDGARHRAVHANRSCRRRNTADGGGEILYHSTLAEVAQIWAVIRGYADAAFHAARREGRHETEEAYLADGILAMAHAAAGGVQPGRAPSSSSTANGEPTAAAADREGTASPPAKHKSPVAAKIIVRIDWASLIRGCTIAGETCEIAGIGSVPVSVVREMIDNGDPFLAAVVTDGVDVATVAHLGRSATAYQQTALQWRDPVCTVEGCNQAVRLQNDHRIDWAATHITLLPHLDRLCAHHHDLKTRHGWRLADGKGKRRMVPPDGAEDSADTAREPPVAGTGRRGPARARWPARAREPAAAR